MSDRRSLAAALKAMFPPRFQGVNRLFADFDRLSEETQQIRERVDRIERKLGADRALEQLTRDKGE